MALRQKRDTDIMAQNPAGRTPSTAPNVSVAGPTVSLGNTSGQTNRPAVQQSAVPTADLYPDPFDNTIYPPPTKVRTMARRVLLDAMNQNHALRFWIGSSNSPNASSLAVQFTGKHYVYRTKKDVDDLLWDVLEHALYVKQLDNGQTENRPWPQSVANITAITSAMHGVAKMPAGITPNSWIEDTNTGLVIPCNNMLLDPVNKVAFDHTDKFFSLSCLPYDYAPDADCPIWVSTVDEWVQGDNQSVELLQEWVGYLISGRTDLHAMLVCLGPKRAGKGTFVRILIALLGQSAVGSLKMGDLVGDKARFSMSSNFDKSLIVFPDVRQIEANEGKAFVQFALNITGEDDIQIDIKNQTPWTGKVPARLMLMSNEDPTLPDPSGAMDSRLFLVKFGRSFAGREDRTLETKLKGELGGILNWALEGLARLQQRGEFLQPAVSAHIKREIDDVSNPIRNFVQTHVYPDPDVRTPPDLAYQIWQRFCDVQGEKSNSSRWFRKHLAAAMDDMYREANYRYDRIDGTNAGNRPSYLYGVGLKGFKTEERVVAEGRKDQRTLRITTAVRVAGDFHGK
jgi:putative DNA primase/helicase